MKPNSDLTGIGSFQSPFARNVARLGVVGFLGALGFILGWELK
jgi:hypothetical protein